jgi:predicted metalloprotease with PDZ domain
VSLGVVFDNVHEERLVLGKVRHGSAAENAGLRPGDPVPGPGEYRWPERESLTTFATAIRAQAPGHKTTITVRREDRLIVLPITL